MRHVSRHSEEEGEGLFCRGDRIAVWCVDHANVRVLRCRCVNVVYANTGAPDDLQLRPSGDQRSINLNLRSDDERVGASKGGEELLARLACEVRNLMPRRFERTQSSGGDRLGDDNACHDPRV